MGSSETSEFNPLNATLQAVLRSRSYNIIVIRKDGIIQAFNEGAAVEARKILGVEYHVGRNFYDDIPNPYQEMTRERHSRVLMGESFHVETKYPGVDGVDHWYEIQYDPVQDEEGEITGLSLANICIDERKKVEQTLKESEEKFRKFFEEAPMAMAMVADYKFVKVNRAFQILLGYSEEEFMGKTLFDITHPEDLVRTREIATSIHDGENDKFQSEKRYLRKDGQSLWANVSGTVIRDGEGNRLYSLIMVENISGRVKAQEALQKSEADLRAVFNSGSQMMTLLSPEGLILDCNKTAEGYIKMMTGMNVQRGKSFKDYMTFNVEFKKEFDDHISRALKGEVVTLERAVRSGEGAEFWLGFSYNPVYEAAGTITGVCMTAIAIDERKKVEEALRRSEADLKAVFNSGSNVMVLIGKDGLIHGFNKTAEIMAPRVLGQGIQVGMLFADTLPSGASLEMFHKSFQAALGGKETKAERSIRAADGRERWVEVNYQPVANDHGGVDGVCFSLVFIDERKKAENDLRESEERYRKLIEFSPEAVVVHSEGRILYVNSSGLRMFGTSHPEKIIGKMILDFVHPDYRELSLNRIQKINDSGDQTEWAEQKLLRTDGQGMDAETKGTAFVYQGRPAVLTIVRDVTDRKKTQGMLLRYERLAAVGNVIAAIAHEIRNPLAVVSGMSQILKAKLENRSEYSQELATILSQTDRLRLFMNDILDYSRETEIKKEKVDLQNLLERSLVTAQTQFGTQHVNFEVRQELDKGFPELWADGERLEQVLSNLILNAFQSMNDNGVLTLSAKVQEGWIFLGVQDNGAGINEADLPHLFEPFFTTKKNGSGLGLPISQKIAEAHRGKIEVHRIEPHGTRFTLQFPLQKI